MGKAYIDAVKYIIYAHFDVEGIVEKPDVIGAMFGQTEGLLGGDLELRNLQKNGKIGRIEVEITHSKNQTYGTLKLPSSLDVVETSIIAAALESVDRIGPCYAKIYVDKIEDNRAEKRKKLLERARSLLREVVTNQLPDSREITKLVRKELKAEEVVSYGKDKLPAGPNIDVSDDVIIVEGRADVINLLKNDIKNVIAIGGAKMNNTIIDLTTKKETTLFLDGDRGGDIILNELLNAGADIDFVVKAPTGKEVEELTRKELIKSLRNKIPLDQYLADMKKTNNHVKSRFKSKQNVKLNEKQQVKKEVQPKKEEKKSVNINEKSLLNELKEIKGKLIARFYNSEGHMILETSVKNMIKELSNLDDISAIVFDGIITQRLVDISNNKNIQILIGTRIGNVRKTPNNLKISTL